MRWALLLALALLLTVFKKEALALLLGLMLRRIAWRFRRRTGVDLLALTERMEARTASAGRG